MNSKQPNMRRDALLRRALVPKGYRPTKGADVDGLLDAMNATPMDEETKARMLRKINGLQATFPDRSFAPRIASSELSETERELVAMYRAKNKELPPDLAEKVKAMEARAAQRPQSGEESAGA
ncbi:MAG: hypothetical protein JNM94_14275 [Phycisphaerae bacterium]|nr:hypothetical protein [Phycisphaerae bacterium]